MLRSTRCSQSVFSKSARTMQSEPFLTVYALYVCMYTFYNDAFGNDAFCNYALCNEAFCNDAFCNVAFCNDAFCN